MSKPASILIVEDDLNVQNTVLDGLARENARLIAVATGEAGLDAAERQDPDLILLDLGLPDLDGFQVLGRLKSSPKTSHIPILLLTAQDTIGSKVRAFDAGASDYITKPFDLPELRARVRSILRAKRLQDDLTESNRQLVLARTAAESANHAKSDFLAQMSHEIRTPMNGVLCMARLLMESNLQPNHHESVETIFTSAESLLTIINDILDFSKIESGKMELEPHRFELAACVDDVLNLLAGKAEEKSLELSAQIDSGAPAVVVGDSTRVRQVLLNLVNNALKFTATGGVHLRVRAEREAVDKGWRLFFTVRDTGIGIAREKFSLLFKSFSQLDSSTTRQFGGTGLGLAISRSLVTMMGGDISVESELGVGSAFHFNVKVADAAPTPPAPTGSTAAFSKDKACPTPASPASTLSQRYPLQMLLVDDNAINQKVAVRLLAQMGYKPDVAGNGLEAVDAVKRLAYDMVLMDVQMPEMDGMAATAEIRKLPSRMPGPVIIAMTANAMHGDREKCLAAGMDDYVSKPIEPQRLVKAIEFWAQKIHAGEFRPSGAPAPEKPAPKPVPVVAPATGPSEPPVNLCRLEQFTDGSFENLKELIDLYLIQTSQQMVELETAVKGRVADSIRRLSHKAAGSSATCGMDALTELLRQIEQQAAGGHLDEAPALLERSKTEFARITQFLEAHLAAHAE